MRAVLAVVITIAIAFAGFSCRSPSVPAQRVGHEAVGQGRRPDPAPAAALDPMAMGGFPVPPQQGRPGPIAASAALPPKLATAAQALFRHGLADPRGCEYREIEVLIGSVWGEVVPVKTHGWVLPTQRGAAGTAAPTAPAAWVIAWNGLVYPALSTGRPADVRADLTAILDRQRAARAGADPVAGLVRIRRSAEAYGISHETADPGKVPFVVQLGEPALAAELWAAFATGHNPEDDERDDDPYLRLATDWAWELFERAVTAHMRGDTAVALASARLLTAAAPRIEAEADRRGIPRAARGDTSAAAGSAAAPPTAATAPHLTFLEQLPLLLADEERRAARGPRRPLALRPPPPAAPSPPPSILTAPPAAPHTTAGPRGPAPLTAADLAALAPPEQVRLLIDHLDEVAARQDGQPGGVDLAGDPIVEALIELGAPAVEPLIAALESDARLTRSVHFWRDFARSRSLLGAHEAAYVALAGILEQSFFDPASTGDNLSVRGDGGRRAVADRVRAYWDRWKQVPLEERWLRALADDAATPEQWLDAADKITRPRGVQVRPSSTVFTTTVTQPSGPPGLRGEPLRAHKSPTVTEAIERRWRDPRVGVRGACALAGMLARWDAAAGAPVMAKQLARTIQASRGTHEHARCIAGLTAELARAGDLAALDAYAAWLAAAPPPSDFDRSAFAPMWQHPRRASIARAADTLFRAGSRWVPLVSLAQGAHSDRDDLLETPLLRVAAFNRHVAQALADSRRVGTLTTEDGRYSIELASGGSVSSTISDPGPPAPPRPGTSHDLRVADWYAWKLAIAHDPAPRFQLYWTLAQRDAAIARMLPWVQAQLTAPAPPSP